MNILSKISQILILCNTLFAHGISESDKHVMTQASLLDYIYLGAKHMITGYDHILFLIGVIFFLTRFSDIIKFITAFTVGHSITLIFATLFEITANYYLIDAVIAFSVIYKGFENLGGFKKWLGINAPNLILMVFIFGLIHGFGLSTRLQQLHLDEHNLIYSILSFNLGVELGQITALAIVFPLLIILRKNVFEKISKLSNWGLIFSGVLLLIYQLNGFFTSNVHDHNQHGENENLHQHNEHQQDHNDGHHSNHKHDHSHD